MFRHAEFQKMYLPFILSQKATIEYFLFEQERCRPQDSWGFNRGGGDKILRMMRKGNPNIKDVSRVYPAETEARQKRAAG